MQVLSLFDGISCGQLALKRAGINVDTYYAAEIKEDGIKVAMDNFPNTIQLGDVTKIKSEDLPKIDLLIGGSPCQSFSIAGKMEGFDGKSGLFWEYARLLKELKPKYFLLENVRMKKEWQDIISEELGVQPININSRLVSAQLRNRFYWTNIPNVEQPEDREIRLQDILTDGFTDRDKARAILESESRPLVNKEKMWRRFKKTGFTTIVHENTLEDTTNIRYFNQTELERLQTLPDGYTKCLTRNKAAGVIGDGWTVDVIAHIFKNIK
jgi:site-specific DNA-cytosine methylase